MVKNTWSFFDILLSISVLLRKIKKLQKEYLKKKKKTSLSERGFL